ncbi:hypothetical protein AGLY_002728, partial [Aphis glycines]
SHNIQYITISHICSIHQALPRASLFHIYKAPLVLLATFHLLQVFCNIDITVMQPGHLLQSHDAKPKTATIHSVDVETMANKLYSIIDQISQFHISGLKSELLLMSKSPGFIPENFVRIIYPRIHDILATAICTVNTLAVITGSLASTLILTSLFLDTQYNIQGIFQSKLNQTASCPMTGDTLMSLNMYH